MVRRGSTVRVRQRALTKRRWKNSAFSMPVRGSQSGDAVNVNARCQLKWRVTGTTRAAYGSLPTPHAGSSAFRVPPSFPIRHDVDVAARVLPIDESASATRFQGCPVQEVAARSCSPAGTPRTRTHARPSSIRGRRPCPDHRAGIAVRLVAYPGRCGHGSPECSSLGDEPPTSPQRRDPNLGRQDRSKAGASGPPQPTGASPRSANP